MPILPSPDETIMDTVSCKLKLGAWEIDTKDDPRTELLQVLTERGMNSPAGRCEVSLFVTPAAKPGLLEQAVGAAASALGIGGGGSSGPPKFSMDVRGLAVAHDDAMEITLSNGDRSAKVMTAKVDRVTGHQGHVRFSGRATLAAAARARTDRVFLSQGMAQIAGDLATDAGVGTGQIDTGDTYPYFVADTAQTVFDHLLSLAQLEGMDLYDDADGAIVMRRFAKSGADRKLYHGIHLLDARVYHDVTACDRVQVTGEGPSSSGGSQKWHHLLKDPATVQSTAGQGSGARLLARSAARSSDAVERLAKGRLGAALDGATRGTLRLLGDPTITLGDAVEVTSAPWPEANGVYKVVHVRHRVVKRDGYVTTLGVTGMGGSDAAGDMLGAALGAVAGLL
ncbi:MAG TPA: hypothetical protein VES88_12185 [Gemmatimonadaceae bacterium]|nr:hypothetical protein [Gemmatimonadaceae bacterium]